MKLKLSFSQPELSKTKRERRKLSDVWEESAEMDFGDLTSKSDTIKKHRLSRTITSEVDLLDLDKSDDQPRFETEIENMLTKDKSESGDGYKDRRISEAGHTHKSGKSASTRKSKKNKSMISNRTDGTN